MSRSDLRVMWKLAKEAARIETLKFIEALEEATTPKSVPVAKMHRCPTCSSVTRKANYV